MSRPDLKFSAAAEAAMDAAELLAALGAQTAAGAEDRREAITRLLAAAPDWREARNALGGAFAESVSEPGLKPRKAE